MKEIEMTIPQSDFLCSQKKYPCFVAGFGSGKTTTMCVSALSDLEYPGAHVGLYAPTYDLLSLIIAPYMEEFLTESNIPYKYNKSRNIIDVENKGNMILRSLDNPARIVGYQTFRSHIDELDTLPEKKAEEAWNKIIARNRQKINNYKMVHKKGRTFKVIENELAKNRVSAYTTPEGFRFCYKRWVKLGGEEYELFRAPTMSNPHLPPDYVESLRATYPSQLIEAYLNGEFVNLTSGSVYYAFDREECDTFYKAGPNEPLHIGMDFNVHNMAAIVHIVRGVEVCAVDEFVGYRDTPDVCRAINEVYPDRKIYIYPDASGDSNSSRGASESDLSIIKDFGFTVRAPSSNPPIKNRVASMNNVFEKGMYRVNQRMCPQYVEALEQQVYATNGLPDKSSGHDHPVDAGGYFIHYRFPIKKKSVGKKKVMGA